MADAILVFETSNQLPNLIFRFSASSKISFCSNNSTLNVIKYYKTIERWWKGASRRAVVSDAVIGAVDNIFGFGQRHGRGMRNNVDWLERKIMVYEKDEMNYKITAPLEFQRGFNLPRYICWRLSSFWS